MNTLKAIIFDMDGTLADTEEIHRRAFNLAFQEYQFQWQWSPVEYRRLLSISGGKERIRRYLQERGVQTDGPGALWRLAEAVHARKSEIYRELLGAKSMQLRPGVRRLIDEAVKARLKLAIATSSSRRNLEILFASTLGVDAIQRFRAVVSCDMVEDKKPSPAVYQFALAELGLEPQYCVANEDTRNGNLAARAAGLRTIITTHDYTRNDDFSGASLVVDSLGEPDQPCQVAAGDAHGETCVSVRLLRRIVRTEPERQNLSWETTAAVAVK